MMEDEKSILYLFHQANLINWKKYKTLGIKDEKLLKKLINYDARYFLYMYSHRKDFDKHLQKILDELPDDF